MCPAFQYLWLCCGSLILPYPTIDDLSTPAERDIVYWTNYVSCPQVWQVCKCNPTFYLLRSTSFPLLALLSFASDVLMPCRRSWPTSWPFDLRDKIQRVGVGPFTPGVRLESRSFATWTQLCAKDSCHGATPGGWCEKKERSEPLDFCRGWRWWRLAGRRATLITEDQCWSKAGVTTRSEGRVKTWEAKACLRVNKWVTELER